jgi:hypothetical protein
MKESRNVLRVVANAKLSLDPLADEGASPDAGAKTCCGRSSFDNPDDLLALLGCQPWRSPG